MRVPEGQVCSEMLTMYQTDGIIAELNKDAPADAATTSAAPSGGN